MNKQDVKNILMSIRNGKNDAVINGVLGKIDLMNEEVLKRLVEEKGGTPDAIMAYFAGKIERQQEIEEKQREIQEEQRRVEEQQRLAEQERLNKELEERQERDITQNPDMNRKLAQLTKGLKQRGEQQQNREYVTLGAKFFEGIPQDKLPEVLEYLKNELGFEFRGNEHGSIEQDGRQISEETITKDELEQGDVKVSIKAEKLQSAELRKLLDEKSKDLDDKALKMEQEKGHENDKRKEQDEGPDDR